jgi:hypothetical protein
MSYDPSLYLEIGLDDRCVLASPGARSSERGEGGMGSETVVAIIPDTMLATRKKKRAEKKSVEKIQN